MSLVVIRLRPAEPVEEGDFNGYLDGLLIKAYDLGINALDGDLIGQADTSTGIAQHSKEVSIPSVPPAPPTQVSVPMAAATAVIEVDSGGPEHDSSDLRLEITRNGGTIVHDEVYFNVPTAPGSLPDPEDFQALEPSSLFLALPPPGQEVGPGDAYVALPADGTPPRFDDLLAAVNIVLAGDPGGAPDPAALTPPQASHVAAEIVWNQKFRPLPEPSAATLEQMYTLPDSDDDEVAGARSQFEGELAAYYATGSAEAMQLAGFVAAVAAAVGEQSLSEEAQRVGFLLPVLPGVTETGAQIKSVRVLLTDQTDPRELGFGVPAAYFYALGATMDPSVTVADRFLLATLEEEEALVAAVRGAIDAGVVLEDPTMNAEQCARRLRALGAVGGVAPELEMDTDPAVQALVEAWLDFTDADIAEFWAGPLSAQEAAGHLALVLAALTDSHQPLIDAINDIPVTTVEELRNRTADAWRELFGDPVDAALLPAFTEPGTPEERVEAFIRHAQQFFEIDTAVSGPGTPVLDEPPRFRSLDADPLTTFAASYLARAGTAFEFGGAWDEAHLAGAVRDVFPRDAAAQAWLEQAIRTIDELSLLAAATPAELRFSVMEALYARGCTAREQVLTISREEFRTALTGTVAYEHADLIYDQAGVPRTGVEPGAGEFHPVNLDACLVDCIPPPHRSPFGPVAYLHELLQLSAASTCEQPAPGGSDTLADLLAQRRGPLAHLLVTPANLQTPLPLLDLANECLEGIAATLPAPPSGAVYDTAARRLAGHALNGDGGIETGHDPATLFAALPEHSTPATPVAMPSAYEALRADFSHPALPYAQALDVDRTYLGHLRTDRFAAMRTFRRDITELVLDPAAEPAEFQRHLWRYPVRIDAACEYLGISAEEYTLLYTTDIGLTPGPGHLVLWELYGFPADEVDGRPWLRIVLRLPEFLTRTGLTYCEFVELWKAGLVPFEETFNDSPVSYPGCEPCYLDDYLVLFTDPVDALRRLAVFIRLWRTLQALPGGGYSLTALRDICAVLRLFNPDGSVNPDFIRQLAAFQMLRDEFGLPLTDRTVRPGRRDRSGPHPPARAVGGSGRADVGLGRGRAARPGPGPRGRAPPPRSPPGRLHQAARRQPRSAVAAGRLRPGPGGPTPGTRAPTHTLRFAEVLSKIYASDFAVGEMLYLFTADAHLDGDDPFPLQPPNEALDYPLGLPDDETPFALWRSAPSTCSRSTSPTRTPRAWTLAADRAHAARGIRLRPPAGRPRPAGRTRRALLPVGSRRRGPHRSARHRRQFRIPPARHHAALMWNTPPDGPFRYDAGGRGALDGAAADRRGGDREAEPDAPADRARAGRRTGAVLRATRGPGARSRSCSPTSTRPRSG